MKAILFDFDYTLADSSRGIIACANHALREMGLQISHEDAIRRTIGLSLPDTFSRLTGVLDEQARTRFKELFLGRAREVMADLTELCPRVRETLPDLLSKHARLGIVSTKIADSIKKILDKEGVRSHFAVIVGGDDVAKPKPDPEGVHFALRALGVAAQDCAYVGDSVIDLQTARNSGLAFVGVLTGVTPREELERAGAKMLIESLSQLKLDSIHGPSR